MRSLRILLLMLLTVFFQAAGGWAFEPVDLSLGGARQVTTGTHPAGLPSFFGPSDHFYAIFRFSGLTPGQRYEATISFESGTDIGYGHSWVDGNPLGKDFWSFTGIGSGTGTGPRRESQQKYLFTVDPASSASVLYLVFRSHKPMPVRVSLQRPSGVTRDSQDQWGYYYVTDFDADRTAPFLLKRSSGAIAAGGTAGIHSGNFIEVALGDTKTVRTGARPAGLPSGFGPADYSYALFRLTGLVPGQRYELTYRFESGTNIGYSHSWNDGNPFGKEYRSFTGIGSGTGSGPRRETQQKFLFTVHPASSSRDLYLVFNSSRSMPLTISLQRPSGVTRESQDPWGYYYVTDFDADRTSPFLLNR